MSHENCDVICRLKKSDRKKKKKDLAFEAYFCLNLRNENDSKKVHRYNPVLQLQDMYFKKLPQSSCCKGFLLFVNNCSIPGIAFISEH